ncbi:MAG: hypothetical protein WBC73_19300 [Phormidesmis sp.]
MIRLPYRKRHWWPFHLSVDSIARRQQPKPISLSKTEVEAEESRVQRRLKKPLRGDRAFLKIVRHRRAYTTQLSRRLNQQMSTQLTHRLIRQGALLSTVLGIGLGGALWTSLFLTEQVTLGGVPYRVVSKVWQDKPSMAAYLGGDRQALHDRLNEIGVEEEIKAYYHDQFENDHDLDRHIHQLMFNRTGYVGEAYQANDYGQLSSVEYQPER